MKDALDWYSDFRPDRITPDEIRKYLKTGKMFCHGEDREGRPCLVIAPNTEKQFPKGGSLDDLLAYAFFWVEEACSAADNNEDDIL